MKNWLAIIVGSAIAIVFLWCVPLPLGIPGEWIWDRAPIEPDLIWNLLGGTVGALLFVGFVVFARRRLEERATPSTHSWDIAAWLVGLAAANFIWLWVVQEMAPIQNRLGKSPFVLYYPSSSGYFTRARYDQPQAGALLAGYEDLMREGDVLHTGTHPPGLFLVFHGLIAACESSPTLAALLDATQPASFQEASDVVASNSIRGRAPRPLLPQDRRVLWLATLLVMLSAALTVIPLYGLLRRVVSIQNAWTCAALWPAMPAVAMFIPKSDVAFPLIGTTLLWLWLTAWDRRSLILGFLAGLVAWCGLICSLAFLPVLLAAALLTVGSSIFDRITSTNSQSPNESSLDSSSTIDLRRWLCILSAGVGLAVPVILLRFTAGINLLNVWWMNYRNHAGFYRQFSRTYWKWLLVNPIELCAAAGWPVTMLAIVACYRVTRQLRRDHRLRVGRQIVSVVGSILFVWGLLWLTGKNSGEAARLWIVLLPWLVWLASIEVDSHLNQIDDVDRRQRQTFGLLLIQFLVCLLTVSRVSGFHIGAG